MERSIITATVYGLYKSTATGLERVGEQIYNGRHSKILKKSDLATIRENCTENFDIAVFEKYVTELRYMSDEDFIKFSKVKEK